MISNKTPEVKTDYFFAHSWEQLGGREGDCNPSHSHDGGRTLHGIERTVEVFHMKKKIALASGTL